MQYSEGYLLDSRYELKRFIGSGTFGEVWVATDTATDLEIAIKVYVSMDEKGLQEFKKEFQISFELNHTNLLHANYLGVNPEDQRPYLVMPFCPDGSVNKMIGKMNETDLWQFIHDVASGLAYLHSHKPPIIHQDIKPDNILIQKNGEFVITDFGISRQLRSTLRKSAMSLNSAGAISYMGPERFSKQYHAVKASDIWSLGVSIYELATGELPFCGMGGSLQKKGADIPDLPEDFSTSLNFVLKSCLAEETSERPRAQQIADFAAQILNGDSPSLTWTSVKPSEEKPKEEPPVTPPSVIGQTIRMDDSIGKEGNKGVIGTVPIGENIPPVIPTPPPPLPVDPFHQKDTDVKKTVSPWMWAVSALAGLAIGLLLNFLV